MRLLIVPGSARNWLVACLVLCAALVVGLRGETQSRPLLLRFVPPEDRGTFFTPQDEPTVTRESAIETALSWDGRLGAAGAEAIDQVVLVHLFDPEVDPPYDEALVWAVNFDPKVIDERNNYLGQPTAYPVVFEYVLVDARTGEVLFSAEGGGHPIGSW